MELMDYQCIKNHAINQFIMIIMKKKFLHFIFLFFIIGSIYSQDFYFGISPGEISSVYSKSGNEKFTTQIDIFQITGNFIFSILFKNNLELETGLIYYPYSFYLIDKYKTHINTGVPSYYGFSLPIHVGYKFKLANRLYANIYSGINFDFYFCPNNIEYSPYKLRDPNDPAWESDSWSQIDDLTYLSENRLKQRFNILLFNKLTLQYFTKFNMGISLYVSYNSGLFQVWESKYHFSYDFGKNIDKVIFLSRGSYWNFGIELGYKLEKKKDTQ